MADGRDGLPEVRQHERLPGRVGEAPALPVPGLPELLQPEDEHGARQQQPDAEAVGLGHLPGGDAPQERVVDEAAPGPGRDAEDRVVHAAPDQGGVGRRQLRGVRRPRRGRRDLRRRPGGQQAEVEAARHPGRHRRQGGGDRRQGPEDQPGGRPGDRGGGRRDAQQLRGPAHGIRRDAGLHGRHQRLPGTAQPSGRGPQPRRVRPGRHPPRASKASGRCSSGRTRGPSTG